MTSILKAFWQEEDGQDLVEYSLLLAFLALAAVTMLQSVKGSINGLWTTLNNQLANANTTAS